jgi:hypothetical protein
MTKKKPPELLQKPGAKSTYTFEVSDRICKALAEGRTITSICSDDDMPSLHAVYGWLETYPAFGEAYARARAAQQDTFAAQIVDISDTETDPQRARNRIDARKWHAAKTAPRKYGDKLELDAKIEHNTGPSEGLTMMLAMLEKAQGSGRH